MARQVLPWVGAAVGLMAGGNWQLGFAIGSLIGNAVDPQVIRGPQLGEGQNNTASEGGYRPIVFGKGRVGTCLIHQGPLIKRTIRTRQSKGGGPVTEEQRAYRTMAFALGECAYPDDGVILLRLWIDNKLRYDVTPTSEIVAESTEFAEEFAFYPGDQAQEPDPDLEAMPVEWGGGAGNVPAYRGGAPYIVFPEWDVTDSGGRAPMVLAELATLATGGQVVALSLGYDVSLSPYLSASDDGLVWTDPGYAGSGISMVALDAGRFFVVNGNQSFWTDNYGATQTVVPLDNWGGSHQGEYRQGVLLIGGTLDGIWRSLDRGETASIIPGSPNSYSVAITDTFAVSVYGVASTHYSVNKSGNWSIWLDGGDTGLYGGAIHTDIASNLDTVAVSGYANDEWPTLVPSVSFTKNGFGWTLRKITGSAGSTVNSICSNPEGTIWLAGTDANEVFWTDDEGATWNLCSDEIGVNDICHNGQHFIIVGKTPDETGAAIAITTNGQALTPATSFPYENLAQLVAANPSYLSPAVAEKIPLSEIATWIHDRVELASTKYNVSALTDLVEGVVFADGYTGASAMQAFMPLYHFDAGEYDAGTGYRINYVKRGAAAAVTLTEADIVEGPEDWEREDSYERPKVLHVAYQNPIADYGAPNIVIKRTTPDVLVVGERSASVPVVFSDVDEITRRADIMMTVIYTEIAGTYELILPWSWLELAPTDVIGFSIRGRVRRLRLDQWRFSPDGTIKTELWADRQSAYTSNVTGLPAVPSTPPPPSIVGPTISAVLDIPGLTDELDTLNLIVAATGQMPAWYGANHQRKLPSDPDYTAGPTFSGITTIMGLLDETVTDASPHFTDTTNVVRVALYGADDELQTYTQEQFLSENGAFALAWEDSGTRLWEIMQYRDAVKVGDNVWELTTLARGRLDTETAEHPAGSLFVLLDTGIRAMAMTSSMIGQDITHRTVSFGQSPDQATPYTEEYTGQSQTEWPVANLFAELNGDDLEISFVPRHRFGTDDNPIRSVNWIGYRVTATDGVNTETLDTTIEGVTFDVTGWSTPITVSVSQLNRITGEGPAVTEEVA